MVPAQSHFRRTEDSVKMLYLKRALDIVLAFLALIVLSPLLLATAVAIRVESRGPVIFCQMRLGMHGKPFRLYKFRKFYHDLDSNGPHVTVQDDPRLTYMGRIIERTKLNELPQLVNVLKGDMSLVGPRPESLEFADCFIPEFRDVLNFVPGIFGPSQVAFRNESQLYPRGHDPETYYRAVLFPAKAAVDLRYFAKATLTSDLMWIVRGALATFSGSFSKGREENRLPSYDNAEWRIS
jgi:lipopolysaccharide/colanic/teichoic acid biosynthesis glycosyltransferase